MSITRREFLRLLAAASAAGMALDARGQDASLYDIPKFGNARLLHFTDCHAQLLPGYYREPQANIGAGIDADRPPHLVGEHLLREFGIAPGSAQAYAFTHLDFEAAARRYGAIGGFAHLATLVKKLRAEGAPSLLLDGGDTWHGSATALWTAGADMIEASLALGVDVMTAHWEFTYGQERVKQAVGRDLAGKIDFVAQNVKTADFNDPVFAPYVVRELGGPGGKIAVAIIGQAFPYTPIAHPRHLTGDWTFGIDEERMQAVVAQARAGAGGRPPAQAVILLSHNGMDVDLKLATRVTGIDAILGGHTHDGVPAPVVVGNAGGKTLVTNAGSNGKFLAVLDLEVKGGAVADYRYRLLPVFSNALPADRGMAALIERVRAPYALKLAERLAVNETLLYRRGNFTGSYDQLILDALLEQKDAEIAFTPGFRFGPSLLPGQAVTMESLLDMTAITYPAVTLNALSGAQIKAILEDVCDNVFHPDAYYRQGGDMVRVGGLTYACAPNERMGARISDLRLKGAPLEADKLYKVAGWAPVAEGAATAGEPVWELVARHLRARKTIRARPVNVPRLIGVSGNRGIA
jgi:sulfur-oxidizing protein SoxB